MRDPISEKSLQQACKPKNGAFPVLSRVRTQSRPPSHRRMHRSPENPYKGDRHRSCRMRVFAYDYFNFDMLEAAHGRPPAVATALKRVMPDRIIFSYQGDGDLAAIGTSE